MQIEKISNGQERVYKILKKELETGFLSHAYLFEINNEEDRKIIDYFIADILKSDKNISQEIKNQSIKVIKPTKGNIKKEKIIELKKEYSTKNLIDKPLIYLIEEAEKMNKYAANSILKFLEEPEQKIIAFFVTNNVNQVIDTISSRCQTLIFDKKNEQKLNFDISLKFLEAIEKKSNINILEEFNDLYNYKKDDLKKLFEDLIILKRKTKNNRKDAILLGLFLENIAKLNYNVNVGLFLDDFFIKLEEAKNE